MDLTGVAEGGMFEVVIIFLLGWGSYEVFSKSLILNNHFFNKMES